MSHDNIDPYMDSRVFPSPATSPAFSDFIQNECQSQDQNQGQSQGQGQSQLQNDGQRQNIGQSQGQTGITDTYEKNNCPTINNSNTVSDEGKSAIHIYLPLVEKEETMEEINQYIDQRQTTDMRNNGTPSHSNETSHQNSPQLNPVGFEYERFDTFKRGTPVNRYRPQGSQYFTGSLESFDSYSTDSWSLPQLSHHTRYNSARNKHTKSPHSRHGGLPTELSNAYYKFNDENCISLNEPQMMEQQSHRKEAIHLPPDVLKRLPPKSSAIKRKPKRNAKVNSQADQDAEKTPDNTARFNEDVVRYSRYSRASRERQRNSANTVNSNRRSKSAFNTRVHYTEPDTPLHERTSAFNPQVQYHDPDKPLHERIMDAKLALNQGNTGHGSHRAITASVRTERSNRSIMSREQSPLCQLRSPRSGGQGSKVLKGRPSAHARLRQGNETGNKIGDDLKPMVRQLGGVTLG